MISFMKIHIINQKRSELPKARKYHPNHFEGTIVNLEFCIEPKLSVKQDDRKRQLHTGKVPKKYTL